MRAVRQLGQVASRILAIAPQVGHVQAAEPDWFVIADLTFTVVRLYGTVDLSLLSRRGATNRRMSRGDASPEWSLGVPTTQWAAAPYCSCWPC